MTLAADTVGQLKDAWRRACLAEGMASPKGRAELRPGPGGPVTVLWRGGVATLWIGGAPAPDPRRPRR